MRCLNRRGILSAKACLETYVCYKRRFFSFYGGRKPRQQCDLGFCGSGAMHILDQSEEEVEGLPSPQKEKRERACRIRTFNLAEKNVRLDLFLGGALLANTLAYKHYSPYVLFRPGSMTAVAFHANTGFRLFAHHRVGLQDGGIYTLAVTGNARKGRIWLVEDGKEERPRTIRLVHAAPGTRRATLTIVGKEMLTAAYREATPYIVWPAQNSNLILKAEYGGENMRVYVPAPMQNDEAGAHSVYLAGTLNAPPEALVVRDGPEY